MISFVLGVVGALGGGCVIALAWMLRSGDYYAIGEPTDEQVLALYEERDLGGEMAVAPVLRMIEDGDLDLARASLAALPGTPAVVRTTAILHVLLLRAELDEARRAALPRSEPPSGALRSERLIDPADVMGSAMRNGPALFAAHRGAARTRTAPPKFEKG